MAKKPSIKMGLSLTIAGQDILLDSPSDITNIKDNFELELPKGAEIELPAASFDNANNVIGYANNLLKELGLGDNVIASVKKDDLPTSIQSIFDEVAHLRLKITRFYMKRTQSESNPQDHIISYDIGIALIVDRGYGTLGPFTVNGLTLRIQDNTTG